jgi:hypothetical protein
MQFVAASSRLLGKLVARPLWRGFGDLGGEREFGWPGGLAECQVSWKVCYILVGRGQRAD